MMKNLCNRSSCSSAKAIAENEDLIAELLLHLPVKSLLRFKCVSKRWRSIISSPYFALRHTRRNSGQATSSLLMLRSRAMIILSLGNDNNSPAGFRIPSFSFLNTTPDVSWRILGSCNGLMLCYMASAFNNYNFAYFVCNLTTKTFITLPRPGMIMNKRILGVNLAFDPAESPHFKVVCIGQSCMLNDRHCQIEIYSSETGLWRLWNGSFGNEYNILQVFDHGVFCNGAVHWLSKVGGDSLYFVLEDESLKTLPMPPMHGDIYTTERMRYLGQSGGHLHLVNSEANMYHTPPMEIYEMGRDYSGWFLKYRIDLNDIGYVFPDMVGVVEVLQFFPNEYSVHLSKYYLYSVLTVARGEDGQTLEVVLSIPNKIISYNPKENSVKVLLCLADNVDTLDYRWCNVFQFKDTLSWL